ncbi:D-alanine transaminase [Ignavibacterium album JCM 16511]|uniref:D-alanine aminotransferase n=1 Tax=Ignavibacterium album (strain DSM 19864 / JCM 16511 / NBRC 101810 / Mat9-16) TaxID=945713 RepID=I0APE2_IGNAJ|nr:D-amino-acid transaminase [Ignavibacterium album]AFH50849.1 D-alanine transaminase [Ignavibacterium album JCM 16511]
MIAYYNGDYLPVEKISVSPFDRGFLFSDGVYEALRTYNKKLFMLQKHLDRLKYSLEQTGINFSEFDKLEEIIFTCAQKNNISQDFSTYIQITRGVSFPRTHHYNQQIKPNLFVYSTELKNRERELSEGVSVILERDVRWNRCDIKSISLLPNVMANQNAFIKGCYEAVFYRDNFITEGSHTNFFAIKDGKVITAPLSNFILNGVTRKIVFSICNENNIPIEEEYIPLTDLFNYEEFFLTGTTTEITPVINIDGNIIGNGQPGKLTKKIQKLFYDFVERF